MPIYSRNSIGSIDTVVANENYGCADMGRILVESVQNDMIVFNAALLNDFKENSAIREGTMVASELTSFREFSVKEAWSNLKEKLKKLWEKIKGVFRQVYAKLTVWLVRNGKAFVAMHRKTLLTKAGLGDCEIPKYMKSSNKFDSLINSPNVIGQSAKFYISKRDAGDIGAGEINVDTKTNELLSDVIKGSTASDFAEKFRKEAFTELTSVKFKDLGISVEKLFDNITSKSDSIKKLKSCEREVDKSIKTVISSLNDAEKKANGAAEAAPYKRASATCSAFERAISISTRAAIQAIKTRVSQDRMVVGKLVAYSPNRENALLEEMAWREGADDFDTQEDIPAEEINAPDVQSDPDAAVVININADECNA